LRHAIGHSNICAKDSQEADLQILADTSVPD
jgi:hypothetical protein